MTGTPLLETPKQLAKRTGLSERQIRHLIETGKLEHVPVGSRIFIPAGDSKGSSRKGR
jgi:excisionase family DNA binding protein